MGALKREELVFFQADYLLDTRTAPDDVRRLEVRPRQDNIYAVLLERVIQRFPKTLARLAK